MASKMGDRRIQEKAEEKEMTSDVKRALAWGFGLGVGFAVAGMALGVFRKI